MSGLCTFNISVIISELDFFLPYTQSCISIIYYARTYIFILGRRTYKWWKGIFLKINAQGHCFLAPAKLVGSVQVESENEQTQSCSDT